MNQIYKNGILNLTGVLLSGDNPFGDVDGFTASGVMEGLAEHGSEPITVRLNCPGGDALGGIAVYNALKQHPGEVRIEIESIAASAGSIIAMAGDTITMRAGALMMVHNASAMTAGNKKDHEKSIGVLNKIDAQMSSLYAAKTGNAEDEIAALMDEETWFVGAEAVNAGFADETDDKRSKPVAKFDYSLFSNSPVKLVAMAERKGWLAKSTESKSKKKKKQKSHRKDEILARLDELAGRFDDLESRLVDLEKDEDSSKQASAYAAQRVSAQTQGAGLASPFTGTRISAQRPASWAGFTNNK